MSLGSIVDYLNKNGQNSSFAARKALAASKGIKDYAGTAKQNTDLLSILRGSSGGDNGIPNAPAAVAQGVENITDNTPGYTAPGAVGFAKYSGKTSNGKYTKSDTVNDLYKKTQTAADAFEDMEYEPSDRLKGYQDRLNEIENSKPGSFQSKYSDTINNLLQSILNEKEFSYTGKDMMSDDLYKALSDQYEHNARKAMQDTMGNAMAATGGYGSSYAAGVGQQAYDEQMSAMNDIAMDLADRAYQKYLNDRSNRYQQLGTVTDLDNTDYGRYRDDIADWQLDRNYYAGRYDTTYGQDYSAFRDAVSDKQNIRDYYASLYGTEYGNDLSKYAADTAKEQWEQEYELSKIQDAREAEKWALQKKQLELALQQAREKGAGGSGKKSRSSSKNSSKDTQMIIADDVLQMINNGEDKNTVNSAIEMSRAYYKKALSGAEQQNALRALDKLSKRNRTRK